MNYPFVRTLAIVAAALVIGMGRSAAQPALPAVNLGGTSFVDSPPTNEAGLYFVQTFQRYQASRFKDAAGNPNPEVPSPNLQVWTSLTQLIYLWDRRVLGGKPGLDVVVPVVHIDFSKGAGGAPLTANSFGLGDLTIGPMIQFDPILGEHGPLFSHRIEAQMIVPTGEYERQHAFNPGSGYFSLDPYWAGTVFLGPKWSASFRAHYLWNARNTSPQTIFGPGVTTTQAGQAVHVNFTTEYEVWEKHLWVGFNGYWLRQITPSQINGTSVAGYREEVLGLGPGLLLRITKDQHLFANAYLETAARSRPEGSRLLLRYVLKF